MAQVPSVDSSTLASATSIDQSGLPDSRDSGGLTQPPSAGGLCIWMLPSNHATYGIGLFLRQKEQVPHGQDGVLK